jgi:hypothetical protein
MHRMTLVCIQDHRRAFKVLLDSLLFLPKHQFAATSNSSPHQLPRDPNQGRQFRRKVIPFEQQIAFLLV